MFHHYFIVFGKASSSVLNKNKKIRGRRMLYSWLEIHTYMEHKRLFITRNIIFIETKLERRKIIYLGIHE